MEKTNSLLSPPLMSEALEQPSTLSNTVTLHDYQRIGYAWMLRLVDAGTGGILADEMGLGKTLTCLSVIAGLIEKDDKQCYLVLAPVSVLSHWADEARRFVPSVRVLQYVGNKMQREALQKKLLAPAASSRRSC